MSPARLNTPAKPLFSLKLLDARTWFTSLLLWTGPQFTWMSPTSPYYYTKLRPPHPPPPLSQGLDDPAPPLSEGLDPPLYLYTSIERPLPFVVHVVMILDGLVTDWPRSHAKHDIIVRLCKKQFVNIIFLSQRQQWVFNPLFQDVKVVGNDDIRVGI